ILHARRTQVNPLMKLIQKLIGLEAKMKQYEAGEEFIEAVEAVGGPALLNRSFDEPANLPTLAEIRAPQIWLDRMGAGRAALASV
ncbi:MAG: zinc-dependent metalloprotease, partial [Actinobacteria bacterium]|nr:zinc-dependent metalloprotease [Actinomycetota bacterium]